MRLYILYDMISASYLSSKHAPSGNFWVELFHYGSKVEWIRNDSKLSAYFFLGREKTKRWQKSIYQKTYSLHDFGEDESN